MARKISTQEILDEAQVYAPFVLMGSISAFTMYAGAMTEHTMLSAVLIGMSLIVLALLMNGLTAIVELGRWVWNLAMPILVIGFLLFCAPVFVFSFKAFSTIINADASQYP